MYLGQLGLLAITISLVLFWAQVLSADFMSKDDRKKYEIFFKKLKMNRTEDEQKFIDTTWHKYYATKVRNISFMIGLPLLGLAFLFDYITK